MGLHLTVFLQLTPFLQLTLFNISLRLCTSPHYCADLR